MSSKKLPPISDWIKESLQLYFKKENLIYLTKFALLQLLLTGLLFLGLFLFFGINNFASFENVDNPSFESFLPYLPAIILGALVYLVLNMWLGIAIILAVAQVVEGKALGVKETLTKGSKKIFPSIILSLLTSLIVIVGLVLLVIPGLIFIVWFYFAQYVLLTQGIGPIESLRRSRDMVRGNFWPVTGRLVVSTVYIFAITMLISFTLLPVIQAVLSVLIAPYFSFVPYLLFRDVKKLKAN